METEHRKSDEVEIVFEMAYNFDYGDFIVEYNTTTNEWSAYHKDEEKYDDRVIINSTEDSTFLFDSYTLEKTEIERLKRIIQEEESNVSIDNVNETGSILHTEEQ